MACRNGPYQVSSHIYTDAEERRLDSNPEPIRALSVTDLIQEQLVAHMGRSTTAGEGRAVTNNIYVNTLNVQIHNHAAGNTSGSSINGNSSPKGFEVGEPHFAMVSHVTGVDFGSKLVKRYYSAEKHVDLQHNLVTYSQTRSGVESTAHALTLGLSSKRATHVLILFDSDLLQQLTSAWPSRIHLNAVETMIQELGASFECTRTKVKRDRFSLYLFAIKKRGVKFSQKSFQTWIVIFYWAHQLEASTDNINAGLSSFLTSPTSVLENALKLGSLLLMGV